MKDTHRLDHLPEPKTARRNAADWLVELDSSAHDAATSARLEAWLEHDGARPGEVARCEAAICLTPQLRDDPDLRWAFDEAAELANRSPLTAAPPWYQRPVLAWGTAALLAVVAVSAWLAPRAGGPASPLPAPPAAAARAPLLVIDFGTMQPAVMLPGEIAVDARAIAVMPFVSTPDSADAALARELYVMLVQQLEQIPGLYVVGASAVEPYVNSSFSSPEIAAQLGVRGIVRARVVSSDDRVGVGLSLIDAASNRLLLDDDFERPIAEIAEMRTEIARQIAVALASTGEEPQPPLPD